MGSLWSERTKEYCQYFTQTHFLHLSLLKLPFALPFLTDLLPPIFFQLSYFILEQHRTPLQAGFLLLVLHSSSYRITKKQIQTLQCISMISLKQFFLIFNWNKLGFSNHNLSKKFTKTHEMNISARSQILRDSVRFVWHLSYSAILLNNEVPTVTIYRYWPTENICSNN